MQYKSATGIDYVSAATPLPVTLSGTISPTITDDTTTNATMYLTWVTAATGNLPIKVSSTKLSFNPSTGTLTTVALTASGLISGTAGYQFRGTTGTAYELLRIVGATNNPGLFVKAVEASSYVSLIGSSSAGAGDLWLGAGGTEGIVKVALAGAAVTGTLDIIGTAASATASHLQLGSTTQSTIGANGAASALTANPLGYIKAYLGTTAIIIPYYNA